MEAAQASLEEFAASDLGHKYKATVATWVNAWDRFVAFLEFAPALRKVIYTTNAIVIWSPGWGVHDVRDKVFEVPESACWTWLSAAVQQAGVREV